MPSRLGYLRSLFLSSMLVTSACGGPEAQHPNNGAPADAGADSAVSHGDTGGDTGGGGEPDAGLTDVPDASAVDLARLDSGGDAQADARDLGAPDMASPDTGAPDGPVVTALSLVVDRDIDPGPTPINQAYIEEINATAAGDRIYSYQKYFRNEAILTALLDAARRGVEVRGIYGDDVDPTCASLLRAGDTLDCAAMFKKALPAHHKNMMILRGDGTARGIIGSHNLRERSGSKPRVHTVVRFEVANGQPVFDYYAAEAERLTGGSTNQPLTMSVPIASGGAISLTFHPGPNNPVLDVLNGITACDGTLWLSYFGAIPDSIGTPVFDRLKQLHTVGCDVRFLLEDDVTNAVAKLSLDSRGVPVEYADFPSGNGLLGHKLVSVISNGEAHVINGSANLDLIHHNVNHNLTIYVRTPSAELPTAIDAELQRYWP